MAVPNGNGTAAEVDALLRARYSVIGILSDEEARVEGILQDIAKERKMGFVRWCVSQGFINEDGKPISDDPASPIEALRDINEKDKATLFVLRDFHRFLADDPVTIRWLRDLAISLRDSKVKKSIVLLGAQLELPRELEKEVVILDWPLPKVKEIDTILQDILSDAGLFHGKEQEEKDKILAAIFAQCTPEAIIEAARGLTASEIRNVYAKSLCKLKRMDVKVILDEKKQIVRKQGGLEFCEPRETLADLAGLHVFKDDMAIHRKCFDDAARGKGVDMPKGILIVGPPGCGKSLGVKVLQSVWMVPRLSLDMANMKRPHVGESEILFRGVLRTAEATAPNILHMDEVEKGFGGVGTDSSGVITGMYGTFLTWSNDKIEPVFIAATANEIRQLPTAFWRKGRFDEIYFFDLPRASGRAAILDVHLRRRLEEPSMFDLMELAGISDGFSPAELEAVVKRCKAKAYVEDRAVSQSDLYEGIKTTVPQSESARDEIEYQRNWAKQNARNADLPEEEVESDSPHLEVGDLGGVGKN